MARVFWILYRKVEARIKEEANRATYYLDETTEPRIINVLEEELVFFWIFFVK